MHMHPLRLSLFALLLLAVLGLNTVEGSPKASIEDIDPQIINLDSPEDELEGDWRNESYVYENHNSYSPENHTWSHNYTEPGDEWLLPNPTWNLSHGEAQQDVDLKQIWGPSLNCDNDEEGNDESVKKNYAFFGQEWEG